MNAITFSSVHPFSRRSGEDTEFFLQLFVEPSEKKIWTVKEMLTQSLKGQGISFIKVHFIIHAELSLNHLLK